MPDENPLAALPRSDLDLSVKWLKWFAPDGNWTLTAIPPDGGKTKTRVFNPTSELELREWLREHSGKNNLYFMVNPTIAPVSSKAAKEDVEELAWLHVDVDPPKGTAIDLGQEQELILAKLNAFKPRPSGVLLSGNGYQAFWRLTKPVYVGGNMDACADLEPYNIQLARLLGGDNCHNLDRVMRLPGTINIPNAKKRADGRREVMADIEWADDIHYDLAEFDVAPREASAQHGQAKPTAEIGFTSEAAPIELSDLVNVRADFLHVIQHGVHPNGSNRYGSRSEALWAVLGEMTRRGCTPDQMRNVQLDKRYAISGHVYDQKRPHAYAEKQVQKILAEVQTPWLLEMNQEFAVVNEGGKARVMYLDDVDDAHDGQKIVCTQAFEDFRKLNPHPKVQVATNPTNNLPVMKDRGEAWLDHPLRRQYRGLRFRPNEPEELENGCLNLWRGFSVEPKPGSWKKLREHIWSNVVRKNRGHYKWLLNALAFAIQHPEKPGEVAIVLQGNGGTGKGFLCRAVHDLFGRHSRHITSPELLTGRFNSILRDCVFAFCDEAFATNDKLARSKLKALITEPTLIIEGKGKDAITARNMLFIMMSSNEDWVIPAGRRERRYAVFAVSDDRMQDKPYFAAIQAELDSGGYAAMLFDLQRRNISGWHPRTNVPQTQALREQQLESLDAETSLWLALLEAGRVPEPGWAINSTTTYRKQSCELEPNEAFSEDLYEWARSAVPDFKKATETKLGRVVGKLGCTKFVKVNLNCWRMPDLTEWRQRFDKTWGVHRWHEPYHWMPHGIASDHREQAEDRVTADTQWQLPSSKSRRPRRYS